MQQLLQQEGILHSLNDVWSLCYGSTHAAAPPVCSKLDFVFISNQTNPLTNATTKLFSDVVKFYSTKKKKDDWYIKSVLPFRHLFVIQLSARSRKWCIVAALSITVHDDHLFLRRIHVRPDHQRRRLATFLVSAAQFLFSPNHSNVAVEIRHPSTNREYQSAVLNRNYLFYVHGLHFQLLPNLAPNLKYQGLFDHILSNTEQKIRPFPNRDPSIAYFRPYFCTWNVRDVLPDYHSLGPWQMFDRLFRYSFDAFELWRSHPNCEANQPPSSYEKYQEIVNNVSTSTCCPITDFIPTEPESPNNGGDLDLINRILPRCSQHLGYDITATELGVGSVPCFFHGYDNDPNPEQLEAERSCFYVVVCKVLFDSQDLYILLRRCIARFIHYLGFLPVADPIWTLSETSKLYDMIKRAVDDMDIVTNNEHLKDDVAAITTPDSCPPESFSRKPEQMSWQQISKETNAYIDHWWRENAVSDSVRKICSAISDAILDFSSECGELEIMFASIILHRSFVSIKIAQKEDNGITSYGLESGLAFTRECYSSYLHDQLPQSTWNDFVTDPSQQYNYICHFTYGHYVSLEWLPLVSSVNVPTCGETINELSDNSHQNHLPSTTTCLDPDDGSIPLKAHRGCTSTERKKLFDNSDATDLFPSDVDIPPNVCQESLPARAAMPLLHSCSNTVPFPVERINDQNIQGETSVSHPTNCGIIDSTIDIEEADHGRTACATDPSTTINDPISQGETSVSHTTNCAILVSTIDIQASDHGTPACATDSSTTMESHSPATFTDRELVSRLVTTPPTPSNCDTMVTASDNCEEMTRLDHTLASHIESLPTSNREMISDPEAAMKLVTERFVYRIDNAIRKLEKKLSRNPDEAIRKKLLLEVREQRRRRQKVIHDHNLTLRVEAQCLLPEGIVGVACTGRRKRSFSVMLADTSLVNTETGLPIWTVGKDFVEENFPSVYIEAVRNRSTKGSFFVTDKALPDATPAHGFCVTSDTSDFFRSLRPSDGPKYYPNIKQVRQRIMFHIKEITATVMLNASLEAYVQQCTMSVATIDPDTSAEDTEENTIDVSLEYAISLGYKDPNVQLAGQALRRALADPKFPDRRYDNMQSKKVLRRVSATHKLTCTIDSHEVHAIRWCDERKKFQGLVYSSAELSPELRKGKPIDLDESWVTTNFTEHQVEQFKMGGMTSRQFIHVPPGAVSSNTDAPPDLSLSVIAPTLRWTQAEKKMCLYCSVASILHHLGEAVVGEKLHQLGLSVIAGRADRPAMPCMSRVREFVEIHFSKRWHPKKLKEKHNVFELHIPEDEFATITIRASDGAVNHCVAISGNLVFDSNQPTALPLKLSTLDWCSGTNSRFVCIQNGYHFVKNKVISSKKKTAGGDKKLPGC